MPLAAYKDVLAFAIEQVVGTPEVLADANVIKVTNIQVTPDITIVERSHTDDVFTRETHVVAGKRGSISFSVEIRGSGVALTPVPDFADLLEACGFVQADNVFTMTSTVANYKTATIAAMHEGGIVKLAGAMGAMKLSGQNNAVGTMDFVFSGVWQPVAAGAILNAPADITPPACNGATVTWGGAAAVITQYSIDTGTSVKVLPSIAAAAGFYRAWLDGRKVTGSIDPESSGVGFWTAYEAGTEAALAIASGAPAGHKLAISVPRCQITSLANGVREGVRIHDLGFAGNGASPLTLTWS